MRKLLGQLMLLYCSHKFGGLPVLNFVFQVLLVFEPQLDSAVCELAHLSNLHPLTVHLLTSLRGIIFFYMVPLFRYALECDFEIFRASGQML